MNAYNRILGTIILVCCLLLFTYFTFPHTVWIRTTLESWIYCLFFTTPILLLIASNRFKKLNDIRGRNLSYATAFCYLASIFFPLFIFLIDFVFIGKDLPSFLLVVFPAISLILTALTSFRLFKNSPVINSANPILESPYR